MHISRAEGVAGLPSISILDVEPIKTLLRRMAPNRSAELDELINGLSPEWVMDLSEDRVLFQAELYRNRITIGLKCTCRLEAHASASAVIITGMATPGFLQMSLAKQHALNAPAEKILNWAVARDLQQPLTREFGFTPDLNDIFRGAGLDLPPGLLQSLTQEQRRFGTSLFHLATAFILFHELAHLKLGHLPSKGLDSIQQEKDADQFAAEWLMDSASSGNGDIRTQRLLVLHGIATALLWLTVFDVYLGRQESETHPEGYDRLFQILDSQIYRDDDDEYQMIWGFVGRILLEHMWSAGFSLDPHLFPRDPRDKASHLIDMISSRKLV